jgi:hypothetical protein
LAACRQGLGSNREGSFIGSSAGRTSGFTVFTRPPRR